MIRFEIPVLDVFLLSDALRCATNRHKIKDYADVMRIMNYRKFLTDEALKHAEEPPAPPKSDTAFTTKESLLEELKKQGVPLEVHKQVMWERDIAIEQLREIGKSLGEKMDDVAEAIKNNSDASNSTVFTTSIGWIHRPDGSVTVCPKYGWSIEEAWTSKYCPVCGAPMDGNDE